MKKRSLLTQKSKMSSSIYSTTPFATIVKYFQGPSGAHKFSIFLLCFPILHVTVFVCMRSMSVRHLQASGCFGQWRKGSTPGPMKSGRCRVCFSDINVLALCFLASSFPSGLFPNSEKCIEMHVF